MPVLAGVTPELVATLYPSAPPVSDSDVQGSSDWVEGQLTGPPPPADILRYRELQRAISAYALYLRTTGTAAGSQASAVTQGSITKSFTIGPIKIDRQTADLESIAASLTTSAEEWLEIAGRHLAGAGILTAYAFPGTAR